MTVKPTRAALDLAVERMTGALHQAEAVSPESASTLVELRDLAGLPHTSPAGSWAYVLVAMRSRGIVGSHFKRGVNHDPVGWGWYLR